MWQMNSLRQTRLGFNSKHCLQIEAKYSRSLGAAFGCMRFDAQGLRVIKMCWQCHKAALFEVIPRDVQYEMCFGGRERPTD
jgi:hypothetical protein